MVDVIPFHDFAAADKDASGTETACWQCRKQVLARTLFCDHCGAVQPVRDMDCFARLGLERRVDIDSELLEKQHTTLQKLLDPAHFVLRGSIEKGHAAQQLEALNAAYAVLRDPLQRGRYWLALHHKDMDEAEAANPILASLRAELTATDTAAACDRVAQKAGQALEQGIVSLMQALRNQNWQQANAMLIELDGLEVLLSDVRGQRAQLCPGHVKVPRG